jgi:hypothetical protein
MNIRTIVILLVVAGAGAYVYVDYNSSESKLARELKEIDQLSPDTRAPECFGKGPNAKLFAIAVERDRRSNAEVDNDVQRRNVIKGDCIRGAHNATTMQRVVKAMGPSGIATYKQVLQDCPVVKDEYPVYACFALDALHIDGSKEATAVLETALADTDKNHKNLAEGALFRLMNTPGWTTVPQLVDRVPTEKEWEAKELIMEYVRNHRDASARPNLEKAYAAETDLQEKGLIKAAMLEIDNPGKCVVTDEGRGANGLCRYTCHDQNKWFSIQKPAAMSCPLVQDLPVEKTATPPVTAASPVGK